MVSVSLRTLTMQLLFLEIGQEWNARPYFLVVIQEQVWFIESWLSVAVIYLFSVLLHPISLSKEWHECHTEILISLLSHCQPYSFLLIGYYCGRFMRILKSWYVSGVLYWHWRWEAVAGVIAGFCTSIMTVILFALLRKLFSCIYQLSVVRRFTMPFNKVRLRRVCFLLAYVSFTSWLAVQYFRRIGLPEIAVYYSM